jgi:hypothetical protein
MENEIYPSMIISTVIFVLNSAVLSSFIIPEVRKLKEIKDMLFKYQIPYARTFGAVFDTCKDGEQQAAEAEKLQSILDVYAVRMGELNSVKEWFLRSIFLAVVAILVSLLLPTLRNIVLSLHPISQLVILLLAINTYTMDPDKVASPEYLVKNCEVNPHAFIQALNISAYYSADNERVTEEDPLTINLSMKLRVYGFRFLFILTDQDNKVFFVSYGPITAKTELWRHILRPEYGVAEHDRIPIGKFKFNSFTDPKKYVAHLLIFMPFYEHETVSPIWGEGVLEFAGNKSGLRISQSPFASISNYSSCYKGISFRGGGVKIFESKTNSDFKDKISVIDSVFNKYKKDFVRTTKIKTTEDYKGGILAN